MEQMSYKSLNDYIDSRHWIQIDSNHERHVFKWALKKDEVELVKLKLENIGDDDLIIDFLEFGPQINQSRNIRRYYPDKSIVASWNQTLASGLHFHSRPDGKFRFYRYKYVAYTTK